MRPRDIGLERDLTELAARTAGIVRTDGLRVVGDTRGLDDFADYRAHPGGVRANINADLEAREELADCRNYLVWGIEPIYQAYLDGDLDACEAVRRRMTALSLVIQAWAALDA